jgi:Ca-activated chloride channel family protein
MKIHRPPRPPVVFVPVLSFLALVGLVAVLAGCLPSGPQPSVRSRRAGGAAGAAAWEGVEIDESRVHPERGAGREVLNISEVPVVGGLYREGRSPRYGIADEWSGLRTPTDAPDGGGSRAVAKAPPPWQTAGLGTELWIIERAEPVGEERAVGTLPPPGTPTQGELRVRRGEEEVPLPLAHTAVRAEVAAYLATVNVTQQYRNPYDTKIEAVYVFPLPQDAAVTDFVMVIGERRIRGVIREREEARRVYEEAKRQGYRAALMTQERPNIFTQRVANIEPGRGIDVELTYFSPLRAVDGEFEFVFPMVVGPRYNPPGSTGGVGAVGRGSGGASGQATEVQYLRPEERSGHDIDLSVSLDAGMAVEAIHSVNHAVQVARPDPGRATVTLSPHDTVPNKDFVLRYRLAGERLKTAFLTHRSERGNFFALLLQPPETPRNLPRMPREMVFVLDCSGSMSGEPLAKAKQAMRRCLKNLAPNDTFQIIRFSSDASALGRAPLPATAANVTRGLEYVRDLRGAGGTRMIEGIKAALDFPHDAERLRVVSFMTDGFIGNETEILAAVHERLGASRIFSFGVGSSVNRYLLERLALMGRGAAAFVGLREGAGRKVDAFYERLARPALADARLDWGGLEVSDVYPRTLPDLFVGRPVLITGRFHGTGRRTLRLVGRCGTEDVVREIPVTLDAGAAEHRGVASLWARWKLRDLAMRETYNPSAGLRHAMLETSVSHRLLCKYTAFLAVDGTRRTAGGHGVTIQQPVPVPDGVRYDTTVRE